MFIYNFFLLFILIIGSFDSCRKIHKANSILPDKHEQTLLHYAMGDMALFRQFNRLFIPLIVTKNVFPQGRFLFQHKKSPV